MSNLSIRGIDPETLAALKALAGQKGASLNSLVLEMIDQGLGLKPGKRARRRHDDLDALSGIWSADEAAEFEAATSGFDRVDADLWK